MKICVHTKMSTQMFPVLFRRGQGQKQTLMPISWWGDIPIHYIYTMKYYSAQQTAIEIWSKAWMDLKALSWSQSHTTTVSPLHTLTFKGKRSETWTRSLHVSPHKLVHMSGDFHVCILCGVVWFWGYFTV